MRPAAAAIVVFLAAGAVLLLEILAVRLVAPYVGVSLNTYTGIIGTVLAGISAGAWIGGWAADRVEPRRLVGPLLILGGVLALATAPLTTALGEDVHSASLRAIVALSAATVFLPAFVLSAVHPIVVKMQLQSLHVTGSVVGRLSAFATAGALVGTFGTGFFLTAHFPTRAILAGIGAVLIVVGGILWWQLMRRVQPGVAVALAIATLGAGAAAANVHGPCKVESAYACIRVVSRGDGRILMLDDLPHSYVDLRNPKHLIFSYTQVMAAVVDTLWKPGTPLTVLHIGAGAFTLPRYFADTRHGSTNTVMEIDPAVVDTAREDFGIRSSPRLHIAEGDARLLVGKEPAHRYDLIIGDAFAGHSVPWQLTTKEFLEEADRLLRPGGAYLMNMLDSRERFVRAEAVTMRMVFPDVVLFSPLDSDNHVLVGSKVPVEPEAVLERMRALGYPTQLVEPVSGSALDRLIGGARFLEDDFAPVDQLLR